MYIKHKHHLTHTKNLTDWIRVRQRVGSEVRRRCWCLSVRSGVVLLWQQSPGEQEAAALLTGKVWSHLFNISNQSALRACRERGSPQSALHLSRRRKHGSVHMEAEQQCPSSRIRCLGIVFIPYRCFYVQNTTTKLLFYWDCMWWTETKQYMCWGNFLVKKVYYSLSTRMNTAALLNPEMDCHWVEAVKSLWLAVTQREISADISQQPALLLLKLFIT